jgi:type I restriction enzyme S subunit
VDALKTHKKGLMQQLFPREGETQPRLRFPEFQNAGEWDFKPFEEFVTKSFYGTSSSTSPTGKYPVLRMGNMVDGGLDFTNMVYLDLDADSFESFRLEDGDILLNRTNSPALVGKISIFRLKLECITASYIVTYRLNKNRIDPSFCNSMLNTPLYQSRIRSFAKPSVSQVNINPTTFKKDLVVSVPSLPEQQRIATCLSSLDALITAETQKLEALKTHKRGLMQQLFSSPEESS